MSDETLTFHFPLPPNMGNWRGHWRRKHNARVEFYERCDLHRMAKLIPSAPAQPWVKATITAHFVVGAANDVDNLMARAKWALDWLRDRQYIADDRAKCLTWGAVPTQRVSRKDSYELTITLSRGDAQEKAA